MRRMIYCCATMTILLALTLTATIDVKAQVTSNQAQANSNSTPWLSPQIYSDPVGDRIMEYKAAKMSDDQITILLTAQGMGWCPQTGAYWLGVSPTQKELATMLQLNDPFARNRISPLDVTSFTEASVDMGSTNSYMGGANNMSPGDIACSQNGTASGTVAHYETTHLGKAYDNGNPCWCEVGVENSSAPASHQDNYYTFENNTNLQGESGWRFLGQLSSQSYQTPYSILLNGTQDQYGWDYNIYINYTKVREGHMQAQYNSVNFADEIFSSAANNNFNIDAANAHFVNSYLTTGLFWFKWNGTVTANFESSNNLNPFPLSYSHSLYQGCYVYDAWTSSTT